MAHAQVKCGDFEVDQELLPLIKKMNENGIKTIYSCCGLDDGNKDKPAYKLWQKGLRPYIVVASDEKANMFIRMLLLLNYKYMTSDSTKAIKLPLIEVHYDYMEGFRYLVQAISSCTFNIFEFLVNEAVDLMKDTTNNI